MLVNFELAWSQIKGKRITWLEEDLSDVTPSLTRAADRTEAAVLAAEETDTRDSFEPCRLMPALPPPLWIWQDAWDGLLLAGLLLTLCKGAKRPNFGRHSKYLKFKQRHFLCFYFSPRIFFLLRTWCLRQSRRSCPEDRPAPLHTTLRGRNLWLLRTWGFRPWNPGCSWRWHDLRVLRLDEEQNLQKSVSPYFFPFSSWFGFEIFRICTWRRWFRKDILGTWGRRQNKRRLLRDRCDQTAVALPRFDQGPRRCCWLTRSTIEKRVPGQPSESAKIKWNQI